MSDNKIIYSAPDGARGHVEDVTGENYYVNPRIELYDELEVQCYELVCSFAEVIGVNLDRDEVDYRLANLIRDTVIEVLEGDFGIPFPVYGESQEERDVRVAAAKNALQELKRKFASKRPSLGERIAESSTQIDLSKSTPSALPSLDR